MPFSILNSSVEVRFKNGLDIILRWCSVRRNECNIPPFLTAVPENVTARLQHVVGPRPEELQAYLKQLLYLGQITDSCTGSVDIANSFNGRNVPVPQVLRVWTGQQADDLVKVHSDTCGGSELRHCRGSHRHHHVGNCSESIIARE
jgi:hypothetical protein